MGCDGTAADNSVHITQQDVDNGLRSPIRVHNLEPGPVSAFFDYGLSSPHRLLRTIDSKTIHHAWVTEEGSSTVYNARLTIGAGLYRDGGSMSYKVELEDPSLPGRYVPLRLVQDEKITTLTIVFRK